MSPGNHLAIMGMLNAFWPDVKAEYKFCPSRRWRFDYAIPSLMIAIEVNGAVWTAGRHSRGSGLIKEYEKMRAAAILGWRVMPFATDEIRLIAASVHSAAAHYQSPTKPTGQE